MEKSVGIKREQTGLRAFCTSFKKKEKKKLFFIFHCEQPLARHSITDLFAVLESRRTEP